MTLRLKPGSRADFAIFLAAAVIISIMVLAKTTGQSKPDLAALYYAGEFFHLGQFDEIYWDRWNLRPVAWQEAIARDGLSETYYAYIYPPVWAALIAPVANALDPLAFFDVFVISNQVLFCGMLIIAWQMFGRPIPLAYWGIPVLAVMPMTLFGATLIAYGQPTGLVYLLILWGGERYLAGSNRAAGVLLALAATIKVYPVLLGVMFLHRGRLDGLAAFVLTGLAMVVLSFTLAPASLHWEFIALGREIGGLTPTPFINVNVEAFLTRLTLLVRGEPVTGDSIPDIAWVTVAVAAANLALIGWIVLGWRQMSQAPGRREMPVAILMMTLLAPIAWSHYFVAALAFLPGLFVLLPLRAAFAAATALVVLNLAETYVLTGGTIYPTISTLSLLAFSAILFTKGAERPAS